MKVIKKILLICLLYLLLDSCKVKSDIAANSNTSIKAYKTINPTSVRHKKDSKLPDTIHVTGTISELTPGECGIFCFGGSIKVKLERAIYNYNNQYVYIRTACIEHDVKSGTKVDLIASKLTDNDTACYYLSNTTTVDSKGFPFYKLSEEETAKIY